MMELDLWDVDVKSSSGSDGHLFVSRTVRKILCLLTHSGGNSQTPHREHSQSSTDNANVVWLGIWVE